MNRVVERNRQLFLQLLLPRLLLLEGREEEMEEEKRFLGAVGGIGE